MVCKHPEAQAGAQGILGSLDRRVDKGLGFTDKAPGSSSDWAAGGSGKAPGRSGSGSGADGSALVLEWSQQLLSPQEGSSQEG